MSTVPYMPLYIERLFASARVRRMKWDERGAYMVLLAEAWMDGARLPNDRESIRALLGIDDDTVWKRIERFVLDRCFEPSEDGVWLVNPPQVAIYAETLETFERNRNQRRGAAKARWGTRADSADETPDTGDAGSRSEPSEDGDRRVNPSRSGERNALGGNRSGGKKPKPSDAGAMRSQCGRSADAMQLKEREVNKEESPLTPLAGGDGVGLADVSAITTEAKRLGALFDAAHEAIRGRGLAATVRPYADLLCQRALAAGVSPRLVEEALAWLPGAHGRQGVPRIRDPRQLGPEWFEQVGDAKARAAAGRGVFQQADARKDYRI
jgi:uncharacterized protein YdaU (DUF1376 family)